MTLETEVNGHSAADASSVRPSPGRDNLLAKFATDRGAVAGATVLLLLLLCAVFASVIAPADPLKPGTLLLAGPGAGGHLLGTDELGRDVLSRLLYGTRFTLIVAFGSAAAGAVVGVPLGLAAGYLGKWTDAISMRLVDLLLAMPSLLLALVIVTVLGSSDFNLIIAIGLTAVPVFARLARASTLATREREYVAAARSMGAPSRDIMFRTILPNILGPLIVQFVITAALAVVIAAGLGFLGLGPPPPAPSWGAMLQSAKGYLHQDPAYGVIPGIALVITVAALDRVGHGMRLALGVQGPRMARRGGGLR